MSADIPLLLRSVGQGSDQGESLTRNLPVSFMIVWRFIKHKSIHLVALIVWRFVFCTLAYIVGNTETPLKTPATVSIFILFYIKNCLMLFKQLHLLIYFYFPDEQGVAANDSDSSPPRSRSRGCFEKSRIRGVSRGQSDDTRSTSSQGNDDTESSSHVSHSICVFKQCNSSRSIYFICLIQMGPSVALWIIMIHCSGIDHFK